MSAFFERFGEVIDVSKLCVRRAALLARFLKTEGASHYAELGECRRSADGKEALIVSLQAERPQDLVNDIRAEETIAIVFDENDVAPPCVFALREDFPNVPHLSLSPAGWPRNLCLYAEPWSEVKIRWTPSRFIRRVQLWLTRTAEGKLHGDDQPLEPLLGTGVGWLILPPELWSHGGKYKPVIRLCRAPNDYGEKLVLFPAPEELKDSRIKITHIALVVRGEPQLHGIIQNTPEDLAMLSAFCSNAGTDLIETLQSALKNWHLEKPAKDAHKAKLLLLLILPKRRVLDGPVETYEHRAFLTFNSIEEVGIALNVFERRSGLGLVILPPRPLDTNLASIKIGMLDCVSDLNSELAAASTGIEPNGSKIFAVGAGSLGSQIVLNLAKAGIRKWCIVDGDVLLPHNVSRHALGRSSVGQNKAAAVAEAVMDNLLDAEVAPIAKDFSIQGVNEAEKKGLSDSSLVCDFSASISVSRYLASQRDLPRCLVAFLAPNGRSLIVLCEDAERICRLDWLEMLQYRAILEQAGLRSLYEVNNGKVRYGISCRDVSVQMAQHRVARWAAISSNLILDVLVSPDPQVRLFTETSDLGIVAHTCGITPVVRKTIGEWSVVTDGTLRDKLKEFRAKRLPGETGGILIGAFDMERRICYLVDALPAPRDSIEQAMGFIRGTVGLRETVAEIEKVTAGQLTYAGEWHSHPDGSGTSPSDDDLQLHEWLAGNMELDGLPGVMLIIGERNWNVIA